MMKTELEREIEVVMRYWSGNISRRTLRLMEEYVAGEELPDSNQEMGFYVYQLRKLVRHKMNRLLFEAYDKKGLG